MRHLLVILAFLLAGPALATDDIWTQSPGGTLGCKLPKDDVCYLDTSTTGATPIIVTVGCREISASWVANITDDTLFANVAGVYRFFGGVSTNTTADANDDAALLTENLSLDGNPATNTETIYGFDASAVYFRVTNSTGTSRAVLQCFE